MISKLKQNVSTVQNVTMQHSMQSRLLGITEKKGTMNAYIMKVFIMIINIITILHANHKNIKFL